MTTKRRPWMQWYPADWRGDPRLRMCSLAARGLWADLISYMHEGEPYGHLTINGHAPKFDDLVRLLGCGRREAENAMGELVRRQVLSTTDGGVIYSRRMVRDNAKRETDIANGKGGGNPKLKEKDNGGVNPRDKAHIPETRDQRTVEPSGSTARLAALDAPEPVGEDAKTKLYRVGKTILVGFGIEEKRTGALIGQWLKVKNDHAGLLALIQYARDQNVADAVSYISSFVHGKSGNGTNQQSFGERADKLAEQARQLELDAGLR